MRSEIPKLVGLQEIQQMLDVSKQYVHELISKEKIKPIASLACGRIFLKKDIEDFMTQRIRKANEKVKKKSA